MRGTAGRSCRRVSQPHAMRSMPMVGLYLAAALAALTMLPTARAGIQTNDECTPTKILSLDLPEFNWHDEESRLRDQYPPPGQQEYSVAELESMIIRPRTA